MSTSDWSAIPETSSIPENDKECLFVWIDILGFSDWLEDTNQYSLLSSLLNRFRKMFEDIKLPATYKMISDGLILQLNPGITTNEGVSSFFNKIKTIQQSFLQDGIFLRGGCAAGTRFKEDVENYISNGLARAYKLESSSISWPIIGTDEKNLSNIKKWYREVDWNVIFAQAKSVRGADIFYLDYLVDLDQETQKKAYFIIDEKIKEKKDCPGVQHKFFWLRDRLEQINKNLISLRCPSCSK